MFLARRRRKKTWFWGNFKGEKHTFCPPGAKKYGFVWNCKGKTSFAGAKKMSAQKFLINTGILEHSKSWNKYWKQNSMSRNLLNKYCKQIPRFWVLNPLGPSVVYTTLHFGKPHKEFLFSNLYTVLLLLRTPPLRPPPAVKSQRMVLS